MRVMHRRRRERARDGWPPTTDNNNGPLGMELVGTGDEADGAADGADGQPGHADRGEDGGEEDESFIEGTQGARDAGRDPGGKRSDDNVGSGGGALIFEDDENKSAMLDSEVVSSEN